MSERVDLRWTPAVVPDLEWNKLFENRASGITWALGSVSRDSYVAVPEQARPLVEATVKRMDGDHSIAEIISEVSLPGRRVDVGSLMRKLDGANLLAENNPDARPRSEFAALAFELAKWRIVSNSLVLRVLAALLMPLLVISSGVVGWALVSGRMFVGLQFQSYLAFAGQDLTRWGVLLAVCLLSVALHELGHAVVARFCGLHPSSVTVALYLFISPIVYVSIPGLYSISPRRRVMVWAAGPYVNLVLAAVAALLRPHVAGNWQLVCDAGLLANLLLIGVNLYPFLPLDGYFMASTLLGVTNLRSQALRLQPKSRRLVSNGARIVLWVYTLATWGTIAAIVLRELWGIITTLLHALQQNMGVMATLDAIKGYLLFLTVVVFAVVVRRRKLSRSKVRRSNGGTPC